MPVYKWSQTAGSNSGADPTINWAEGQAPSSINDSARAEMAAVAMDRDDKAGAIVSAGSSTAYTVASYSVYDTLAHLSGQSVSFSPHTPNGAGPVTLNVDGLGAKPLRLSPGVELPAAIMAQGAPQSVIYNNANGEFYLRDYRAPPALGANSVTTSNITAANVTYAKLQNESGSTLLGNPTGSPAAPSEITLGANLAFSGTALVASMDATQFPGFLSGLTLSTAGGSATFGVAAGGAVDTASGGTMALASAYTKTTSAWAVGSGNGALDTSTIANSTWYHVYLIKRTDTGVVDVLISLSVSSPTMPTSYTLSRRIGSMKTDGSGHWTQFTQVGDRFIWAAAVADVNGVTGTTSRVNTTLTVPTGLVVNALFRGATLNGNNVYTIFTSLFENDVAGPSNAVGADLIVITGSGGTGQGVGNFARLTNTSAQIGVRSSGTAPNIYINTYGWEDARGK